ncbi:MAG: CotH kinase family protein [Prevotellaceae bacterium]|jgi:hypothetical protein|nr:CotH kinase family protein [Prevotellaceae bacterium]
MMCCAASAGLLLAGCVRENPVGNTPEVVPEARITAFAFQELKTAIVDIEERAAAASRITVYVPDALDARRLTPDITFEGVSITPPSGAAQDFSQKVSYTLKAANNAEKQYDVVLQKSNSTKAITSFGIKDTEFVGEPAGSAISLFVHAGIDLTRFAPYVEFKGYSLSPGAADTVDFTNPVVYTVTATDGSTAKYTVHVQKYRLPVMFLYTPKPIDSKDEWVEDATYTLYDGERQQPSGRTYAGKLDVKGRGNTTWYVFDKKPYTLRLAPGGKAALLRMPAQRHWVLLANHADKTLIRNALAFKIGEIFNAMPWTPRSEQVELFLNNEYAGVYQLTEQIRLDENRVNVSEISSANPEGGYLMELVHSLTDIPYFRTHRSREGYYIANDNDGAAIAVNVKDPDTNLDGVWERITTRVQEAENAIYAADFKNENTGYRKYFDEASIVDFYLQNEIVENPDVDHGSVYFYYNPDIKKYVFGPGWDFDLTLGNYPDMGNNKFLVRHEAYWLPRILDDEYITARIKARWAEKKNAVQNLLQFIDDEAAYLDGAQQRNFNRWDVLGKAVYPGSPVHYSYEAELQYLTEYFENRIAWIDAHINEL